MSETRTAEDILWDALFDVEGFDADKVDELTKAVVRAFRCRGLDLMTLDLPRVGDVCVGEQLARCLKTGNPYGTDTRPLDTDGRIIECPCEVCQEQALDAREGEDRARGGFAAIAGQWPGDETDEEIELAMRKLGIQGDGRTHTTGVVETVDPPCPKCGGATVDGGLCVHPGCPPVDARDDGERT